MHLRRIVPAPVRALLRPIRRMLNPAAVALQGYVRQRGPGFITGWLQDADKPARRVPYQVLACRGRRHRVIATGVADLPDPELTALGLGDGRYGLRAEFPRLEPGETVEIRPHGTRRFLPTAERVQLGYIQSLSARHAAGWLHGEDGVPLHYEVVCALPGRTRVLAHGLAQLHERQLAAAGHINPDCGFRVEFDPPLTPDELAATRIRCVETGRFLTWQNPVIGMLRERSRNHVAGWVIDHRDTDRAVPFEVVCTLPGRERVLAEGLADKYDRILFASREHNPAHGFRVFFPEVTAAERDHVEVRPAGHDRSLPHVAPLVTEWKPVRYIAMDIVDNCNLRCPFCLFDHAPVHRTQVMDDDVFDAALRWLPYVGPEGHWMSCLHEPTMHPRLTEFLTRIPPAHRHVMTYTTNLTRRMPDAYWAALADSGLSNINVSIESRVPEIYERMRKGAKFRIFMENWEKLLAAFAKGKAPPPLRYIAMAYKSNYREIPELIEYLRTERNAWKIEIRDTYDVPHIPDEFRKAEFLERHEWEWLRDALAHYAPTEVALSLPPDFDAPAAAAPDAIAAEPEAPQVVQPVEAPPSPVPPQDSRSEMVEGLLEARLLHDGLMIFTTSPAGNYPNMGQELARLDVREIPDPGPFIAALLEKARAMA